MPMSRLSLLKGKSPAYLQALSDGLHQALVEAFEVPPTDRFQIIHQHEANELIFDRHYLGGPRSADFVLIQINVARVRSEAVRQAFYQRLVDLLAQSPGLQPQDVMIIISTSAAEDWSFGGGVMYDGVPAFSSRT
ncbi:tautomerase family protein [Undibacterium sp. CY18W]|uniref:Tautomerase family protein n=1 Tax=Undibacterium hunanense TaxID=2762292 RepID=A0ABR6ZVR7_9BURK|nr:tautomerase family protein [Undibacterium hunanense]MBC3919962.1 tautomerase family protein [Undibacterium hunanense]